MDSSKEAAFLLQGIDPLEVPQAVAFMEAAAPYMGVKLELVNPLVASLEKLALYTTVVDGLWLQLFCFQLACITKIYQAFASQSQMLVAV